MKFREAIIIELLGGALVIALVLLSQRAHAQTIDGCYQVDRWRSICSYDRVIEAPDYLPSELRQDRVYDDSFERSLGRPYSDDYPGYAPLDPAVHDQLDRIERRLNELQR